MQDAPVHLPFHDPQFWIVTIAAVGAGSWIVWRLIPKRFLRKKRGTATRTTLTVGGKPVGGKPARSKPDCPKCH